MIKHYVTLYYPGAFVSETSDREVASRDVRPEGSDFYAWRFYDRECVISNGEECLGNPKNYSPTYFIGEKVSAEEVKQSHGEDSILYQNIHGNGYSHAVKLRNGQYQLLGDKDVVFPC